MDLISDNFIPARFHIKEQKDAFERFRAQWTPTILILDENGNEQYRIEGFLPLEDFLAQLEFGLARVDFAAGRDAEAAKRFNAVLERYPNSALAPEARYWAGAAAYKATGDPGKLKETGEELKRRWPDSEWTRKASVWLG